MQYNTGRTPKNQPIIKSEVSANFNQTDQVCTEVCLVHVYVCVCVCACVVRVCACLCACVLLLLFSSLVLMIVVMSLPPSLTVY